MARPTNPEKENPFKGIEGGFVMKPKAALLLRKEGKLSGDLQYYLLDYMLSETVSAEGKPERLAAKKATAAFIAEFLGFSVKCTEEALADGAERGLWERKKVRGAWQYQVTWAKWAKAPKYEAKKPEVAETVAEVPELRDAKQFVVKPGRFRFPVTLAEAVAKLDLAGDIPHGLRFEYGITAGTLQLNVFGSEEIAKQTPPARGVAPKPHTDSKVVSTPHRTKSAQTAETPPDALYEWAQSVPASHLHIPVPNAIMRETRANLGDASVEKLKARWELRKGKYTSHGMLPRLALDVAKAEQKAKSTVTPELLEEFIRLSRRGIGDGAIVKRMGITDAQFGELLTQMESAENATHGAGGGS